MNGQQVSEAIQLASGFCSRIAEDLILKRQEMKMMEREAELEKEIAEHQQRATADQTPQQPQQAAPQPEPAPEPTASTQEPSEAVNGVAVDVTPLREGEECEICLAVLDEIEKLPSQRRAIGLAEYGQMKQQTSKVDDPRVLANFIEQTDVLSDVVDGMA